VNHGGSSQFLGGPKEKTVSQRGKGNKREVFDKRLGCEKRQTRLRVMGSGERCWVGGGDPPNANIILGKGKPQGKEPDIGHTRPFERIIYTKMWSVSELTGKTGLSFLGNGGVKKRQTVSPPKRCLRKVQTIRGREFSFANSGKGEKLSRGDREVTGQKDVDLTGGPGRISAQVGLSLDGGETILGTLGTNKRSPAKESGSGRFKT